MAKERWSFHIVADDGAATFGFPTRKSAEEARQEMVDQDMARWFSSVMQMVPGMTHWVIHIRRKDGQMQSFGFESQIEAMKFHKAVRKAENVELVSFPAQAELKK